MHVPRETGSERQRKRDEAYAFTVGESFFQLKGPCTLYHCGEHAIVSYRLWDSNPHSFELDFESSASTNSAKSA